MQSAHQAFYQNDFRYEEICNWLTRDGARLECVEFALDGAEVFRRFLSVRSAAELKRAVVNHPDIKALHIGAVYDDACQRRATVARRELVFDLDLHDYDFLTLTDQASVDAAWPVAATGAFVVSFLLRTAFAFDDVQVFYAGRRGLHIYALDKRAGALAQDARKAMVSYMNYSPSEDSLRANDLVFSVAKAHGLLDACKYAFVEILIEGGLLNDVAERVDFVGRLALDRHFQLKSLADEVLTLPSGRAVYEHVAARVARASGSKATQWIQQRFECVLLAYTWPRLDAEVTSSMAHLIKSPFCAHPKSGRVAVPIDGNKLYDFNPASVPCIHDDAPNMTKLGVASKRFLQRVTASASASTDDLEDTVKPSHGPCAAHKAPRKRSPLVPAELR